MCLLIFSVPDIGIERSLLSPSQGHLCSMWSWPWARHLFYKVSLKVPLSSPTQVYEWILVNFMLGGNLASHPGGKSEVCILAKWPIRPELIPVSVA